MCLKNNKNLVSEHKAFTLIELLVVIAIIGLLSTMSVVALANARKKALATTTIAEMKQIEKGMLLLIDSKGLSFYPGDRGGCSGETFAPVGYGGDNIFLWDIVGLDKFIKRSIVKDDHYYYYDNDCDTHSWNTPGQTNIMRGANLYMRNAPNPKEIHKIFPLMDEIIDGGDGEFNGRLRKRSNDAIVYGLAEKYTEY